MHRINTIPNHSAHSFRCADAARLAAATDNAITSALRRVGSEAIDWNRRSGSMLDTARLAFAAYPDARIFGRIDRGNEGKPALGVTVLIDSSGSMSSPCKANGVAFDSRRTAARAIAAGIAQSAQRLGLGCVLGHHGADTSVRLQAHRTTVGALNGAQYGSNLDAWAVNDWLSMVALPAERNLFVLVCDGAPCGTPSEHREQAVRALGRLERTGDQFILAYIGDDQRGLDSAHLDWGALRVADCRDNIGALTQVVIRAVARLRR